MAYSDADKATALLTLEACRGNTRAASRFCKAHYQLDISHTQIAAWEKGQHVNEDCKGILTEKKGELAELYESEIRCILPELATKRADAAYGTLVTGLGILTDKMQILRGQPNSITQTNLSEAQQKIEAAKLILQLRERKTEAE